MMERFIDFNHEHLQVLSKDLLRRLIREKGGMLRVLLQDLLCKEIASFEIIIEANQVRWELEQTNSGTSNLVATFTQYYIKE